MQDEYRALLMRLMRVNRICFLLSYAHLEELGLYPGQPQMLITLLGRDGISQRELAQALCCSQQTYSDYECGKVDIPTSVLIALADYYATTTDYLLGLTQRRERPKGY